MRFKKNSFMPFTVLGDPDHEASYDIIKSMIDSGADALELGFAFSDPIADGPVIQKANNRALAAGITTAKSFEIINKIRSKSEIPISVMLSYNIMFNYGVKEFYEKCKELSIDAVLIPDVPPEESDEVLGEAEKNGINQVFIVSPVTTDERMKSISRICNGYVYLVSLLGTTGKREDVQSDLKELISRTKKHFNIPVYVGFGISKPEHAIKVLELGADGAIMGSSISSIIEDNLDSPIKAVEKISVLCKEIKEKK